MASYKKILSMLLITGIMIQTFSCATVAPPPGGPEDTLSPRVSGTTLAPNSINQNTNLDVTLQFDKWIVQKPPNGSAVISPPIAGRLRLKADGDKLRIYSEGSLDSNTTYTLTLTNAIKDLRGNPLEKPFQILFSTGNYLDSLTMDFSVLLNDTLIGKKKFPVVAFYPIGEVRSHKKYLEKFRDSTLTAKTDTMPNIIKELPQYISQADSLGEGTLQGMQAGNYLAVAFLDENNNQKLDVDSEIAGIGAFPFKLTEEKKMLRFSLGDLDTSSVTLEGVSQRSNRGVEFSFSRPIILDSLFKQKGNCFLATTKDTVFSSDLYIEPRSNNAVLVIDNLKNDSLYTAKCFYAIDSLGRTLDTARNSAKFKYKKIPDKEITATAISKTDPVKGAADFLPGQPIKLYFNHPILADTIKLRMEINDDSVNVDVKQIDAVSLEINSVPPFGTDSRIKLVQIEKDSIIDTLLREKILLQFNTISKLKLASLKGSIPRGNAQTVVVLYEITSRGSASAENLKAKAKAKAKAKGKEKEKSVAKTFGREWRTKCNASGYFEINALPEGFYKIMYFKDLNGDGRLSSGSVFPLSVGEPWASPEEDLVLPYGDDNFLKELIKDLPGL